ncbi:hypothetical protein GE21DRAFT_6539 [Neurospora crassa]|uniref:RING-type domain-containing protein n=1 Tax=Neurospora crassa (strain ATCC 24698 / 74-OR23-1A / CBS 708.71 / DSM 1257 / FGSC 987) TaxID=367110 RepID=Q7S989_NEUCR|nr:hypothetical protein NCU07047 [Neurospora crassa OR74A]EAA32950.2 hypothetical protein NCU07047 [Neurospora crassa OR74A]KHE80964.1 hypothetical protein GE21DRAFT_6539 [Neurospora crassa]|eukprot:XP_962186.2 hypothetical protein NCU07047 [Neurospora crassa OR74A]
MSLPWLQDVDPAERLPDDTKWEDYDEFTLWKQCKLRGLDGQVKREGDVLRLLNALKRCEVEWFEVRALSETCAHILYLELHVVKCPRRLHHEGYLNEVEFGEYFANAPPGFKPQKFVKARDINSMISDKDCQLCFMEAKASRGVDQCQVCGRVAHQKCKNIYRARRAACEGDTGCPLCCPNCPWNPSNAEVKAELVPTEVKKEQGVPRDQPATAQDAVSSAAKHKVRKLKQKVRRLRCQLRRKPANRVMSSLRYERLAGKIGRKGAKYRRNKLIMAVKKTVKSEDAHTKHEDKAAVLKEEMESPVKIIKVEKTKKVKSEPVVISLL